MKIVSIAIIALMVLFSLVANANVYYISTSGNDNNTGSSDTYAWRSIDKVNNTYFIPGDTILFEGGSTFPGAILFRNAVSGLATNPIVIGSYGTGRATIYSGNETGIYIRNSAGFKIKDLVFQGSGREINTKSGVEFFMDLPDTRLSYVFIDNVEVFGYRESGIKLGSWNGTSGYDDVNIINCSVHDNGDSGINMYADLDKLGHRNVYVAYTKAFNNAGIPNRPEQHSGNGIVLGGVDGGVIEHCEAYNNGWLNARKSGGPVGIWCYVSNNVIIQYNESHHNRTGTTKDGGGFDIDGGSTNCIIQYNYSHNNEGPGYLIAQYDGAPAMKGVTIRYNISENDGRRNGYGAIHLWSSGSNGGIQDAQIYNNTIFVSPAASGTPKAIWVESTGATEASFRNNLLVTTGGLGLVQVDATAKVRFEGNNYWASGASAKFVWGGTLYSSIDAWRTVTKQETLNNRALGSFLDPLLVKPGIASASSSHPLYELESYRLDKASPMVGRGLDLAAELGMSVGKNDFWGNSIVQRSDLCIGAYQATDETKLCLYGGIQALSFGQASGGQYAGRGVSQTAYFDPMVAGVGNHPVTYSYTDAQGQYQVEHQTIRVIGTDATEWTAKGGTSDWYDQSNWSTCVPTPSIKAAIPVKESTSTSPSVKPNEHAYAYDLTGKGQLTVEQNAFLEVSNAMNASNLTLHPQSSIVYKSDSPQPIPAGTYGNLILAGKGQKKLTGEVTVTNQLNITGPKLLLGDHDLILDETAGVASLAPDSYAVTDGTGKLTYKAIGAGMTRVFPVGTARGFAPVTLKNDGVTDNFSIRVEENAQQALTATTENKESIINKTWYIEEDVKGGSDVTLSLQWTTDDEPETFNRINSYVSHYEEGAWQVMKSSEGTVTPGATAGTYMISLSGVHSFSPFSVGSMQSSPIPLPVSLSSFVAVKQGIDVTLKWETASELNNHGFDVEVSEDGDDFRKLGFVRSNSPTSSRKQYYTFRDVEAGKTGIRYYRLRQIDLDGTSTYSTVRVIHFDQARFSLSYYPNPFQDFITIEIEALEEQTLGLTLMNLQGQVVFDKSIIIQKGFTKLPVDMRKANDFSIYFLHAKSNKETYTFKLLKK